MMCWSILQLVQLLYGTLANASPTCIRWAITANPEVASRVVAPQHRVKYAIVNSLLALVVAVPSILLWGIEAYLWYRGQLTAEDCDAATTAFINIPGMVISYFIFSIFV